MNMWHVAYYVSLVCVVGFLSVVTSAYVTNRRKQHAELAKVRPITVWLKPTHPADQIKHAAVGPPGRTMIVPMRFAVEWTVDRPTHTITLDVEVTAFHP